MSHIVQIQTEVRDSVAIGCACSRLGLEHPTEGTFQLFVESVVGLGVRLPDWRYPVVCDTNSGQVKFDNYEGKWGDRVHLDRFLQAYAAEKTKIESRRAGHRVTEQTLADGSIKLSVQVGGAS